MLNSSVWQNPEFAKLSDRAKLLYIGMITVADDDGRLRANSLLLRSQIFPFDEKITQMDVRKLINEVVRSKLIEFYNENSEYFVQHPNWQKHQYIRKDLYKPSKIPKNPLRKRNASVTGSLPSIDKSSIDKSSGEKLHHSLEYLKNIPVDDLFEWYKRFDCSKKALISKGEDLYNYCESKGKRYKNYKSFMLTAIKKDFDERKESDPRRNLKLVDDNGVMRMIPKEMQVDIKKLADKMSGKNNG